MPIFDSFDAHQRLFTSVDTQTHTHTLTFTFQYVHSDLNTKERIIRFQRVWVFGEKENDDSKPTEKKNEHQQRTHTCFVHSFAKVNFNNRYKIKIKISI